MAKDFDTDYTDEITCPYPDCGYVESDSWEYSDLESTGRVTCGRCGREFWATRNVTISYSTEKVNWKLDGEKKIDRCSLCSNFEKVLKDYNGFKDHVKRCKKNGDSIFVNTDENIAYNCPLEDTELDDEIDEDNDDGERDDGWVWDELHDTD